MCIDSIVRAAFDLEYDINLIHDACATSTLKYQHHTISADQVHYSYIAALQRFAACQTTQEFLTQKLPLSPSYF